MSTKKVLLVIPSVGPLRGGPSALVRSLAVDLTQHGIETHVATTDDNGPETLDVPLGTPVDVGGVTYWYFPRQTRFYNFSFPLTCWLARHVSDFDVVHLHALFSYATLAGAYWAHRRGVPYVVGPLGTLNEWGMKNRRRWLKKLSFSVLESRVIRNAAYAVYASQQERVEAERLPVAARPTVIPHAVPATLGVRPIGAFRARYPELEGRQIVLFLSRLDTKKGLDLLLNAFVKIRQHVPDASLVLAGAGRDDFVKGLVSQAAALGIERDVVWPGFLDDDQKQAAFGDARLFVLPSYSENFGIAVAEAMAAGVPVVISDQVGIHHDVTGAGAGLVVACDIAELAEAVVRVLLDETLRQSMGQKAKALARERYSSSGVTQKLIAVYNEITH